VPNHVITVYQQAYTSQIVVMAMLALAIGGDAISSQTRREAIIDGLFDLPSKFLIFNVIYFSIYCHSLPFCVPNYIFKS
jgi:glucosamine--fructose-6-phosphate aminotransferase (isomerizing)